MDTTEGLAAKAKEQLEAGFDQAKKILNDNEKLKGLAESARAGLSSNNVAQETMENVVTLINMIEDYANGSYKTIPTKSIVAVISAVAYWVTPIDLIPDFFAFVGKVDDAAVVVACLALIGDDLQTYKDWKETAEMA